MEGRTHMGVRWTWRVVSQMDGRWQRETDRQSGVCVNTDCYEHFMAAIEVQAHIVQVRAITEIEQKRKTEQW